MQHKGVSKILYIQGIYYLTPIITLQIYFTLTRLQTKIAQRVSHSVSQFTNRVDFYLI